MRMDRINEVMRNLCDDSGFDMETAKFVIETYLNQTNDIVINVLEMLSSSRADTYQKVEGLMHKLKGSSGNVRANYIMQLAIRAEESAQKEDRQEIDMIIKEIKEIIESYQVQLIEE